MVSARTRLALIWSALSTWGGAGAAGAAGAGTITVVDDAGGGCGLTSMRTWSAHAHPNGSESAASPATTVNNVLRLIIVHLLVLSRARRSPPTDALEFSVFVSTAGRLQIQHRPCHPAHHADQGVRSPSFACCDGDSRP